MLSSLIRFPGRDDVENLRKIFDCVLRVPGKIIGIGMVCQQYRNCPGSVGTEQVENIIPLPFHYVEIVMEEFQEDNDTGPKYGWKTIIQLMFVMHFYLEGILTYWD